MKNNKFKPLVVIQCYEDRQQTLPLRKVEQLPTEASTNNAPKPKKEATDNPPPPPPMPTTNGHHNGEVKENGVEISQENSIAKSVNTDLNKVPNFRKNGTLMRTPTPDYNNKIDNINMAKNKDENVDLESLESYKLKNPSNVQPKPPPNYFVKAPNGTATMKKHARPVSVTIGEYASSGGRREPTKLDFLNGDKPDGAQVDDEVSISNRLQSELALTLSRSNLRKKTEALADAGR